MRTKIVIALLAFGLVATAGVGSADAGFAPGEDTETVDAEETNDGAFPCEMHTHWGGGGGSYYFYPHPHCF